MKTDRRSRLRELVATELDLLCLSGTMGGALVHLKSLLEKVETNPLLKPIIIQVNEQIAEEDRLDYENFQKSVDWFHSKIRKLLPFTPWEENSFEVLTIKALLTFNVIILGSREYIGLLYSKLLHIASVVIEDPKRHVLFEGWAKLGRCSNGEVCIEQFCFPAFVEKETFKRPLEEQLHQWKEQTDTCLPTLLRFLKILALYDSFDLLVLPADSQSYTPIKNLEELVQKQCQAYVGNYLSLFKSADDKDHPLSFEALEGLVDRFLCMLEQEVGLDRNDFKQENEKKASSISDELYPSGHDEVEPTQLKEVHWRSRNLQEDILALIPEAKKIWIKALEKETNPRKLGRQKLAEDLLAKLPYHISLHTKDEKRIPRALEAIKVTDPRIWKNGECVGLKPHWKKFEWVNTSSFNPTVTAD